MRQNEQFSQLDIFKLDIELFNPSAGKNLEIYPSASCQHDETGKSAVKTPLIKSLTRCSESVKRNKMERTFRFEQKFHDVQEALSSRHLHGNFINFAIE